MPARPPRRRRRGELSTAEWRRILDEVTRAGCLYFLITGGEPLLRPDFREIYRHAKENGLLVTLFTNATLVDEAMADFFAEFPPRSIEISLYGAGPAVHDAITGSPGSFQKRLEGIQRLLSRRLPVWLKSMLMSLNRDEIPELRELAAGLGVRFRIDALLFPRFDRDPGPLGLRVSPEEAVAAELPTRRNCAAGGSTCATRRIRRRWTTCTNATRARRHSTSRRRVACSPA